MVIDSPGLFFSRSKDKENARFQAGGGHLNFLLKQRRSLAYDP